MGIPNARIQMPRSNRRRWLAWGAFLLLLCSFGLLALWAIRLVSTGRSLLRGAAELRDFASGDWKTIDRSELSSRLHGLCGDLSTLRREAAPLLWVAPAFRRLPRWGGDAAAAPALLEMADEACRAGVTAWDALEPLVAVLQDWEGAAGGEAPSAVVAHHLAQARPALATAEEALERAIIAYGRLDPGSLSPQLQETVMRVGALLPTLRNGLTVAQSLPALLGSEGDRTYLILAQNEDELRATGGFITGFGLLTLREGRIERLTFANSYQADDYSRPYPPAPEAMSLLMGIDLWVFRDSNWSPDFPTAAQQATALLRLPEPVRVDGVVALDQEVLRRLVEAVEPLQVGPHTVTGETVLSFIRASWAPAAGMWTEEEWQKRKDFMGEIARALLERVQAAPEEIDWESLGRVLAGLLEEKHLLCYFPHDKAIARLLAERGWDGALRPTDGDFLMVVDSNVGYNKVNPKVQEGIFYQVDLSGEEPRVGLTLTYTHTGAFSGEPCRPEITVGPTYETLMDRCYWDYVRVYTPQESRLRGSRITPVDPAEILGRKGLRVMPWHESPEHGHEVLAAVLVLPRGEKRTMAFTYTLPAAILHREDGRITYTLLVQKQPGTKGHALSIAVQLPSDAQEVACAPFPCPQGNPLVFRSQLVQDVELTISFRER